MRRTNKIIITVVIITAILLGIGYAAIQNITLNLTGTTEANPSQGNFKVRFIGTPTVSDESKVEAGITSDTEATINVTGLTAKGDIETAKYTVENASADLSANLSVKTTNSNEEYFIIEAELEETKLLAGKTTTLTITVELIKTPIEKEEKTTIEMEMTAEPVQPGEESGGGSSSGGTTGGTETTTSSGTYLPTGFSEVEAATATTGLTIADGAGNEYVWVEVPQDTTVYSADTLALDLDSLSGTDLTNAYIAIEDDLHTYTATYRNSTSFADTWYSEDQHGLTETEYYTLKNKMLKSVFENGGFYVGKYETGIADSEPDVIDETVEARTAEGDTTQTPVIQANAYPYNYVICSQAQTLASSMTSGEYTSSLMFGVQWDLVLKYMETKAVEQGTSQDTIISALNLDSTSWGNFSNNFWNVTNTSAKNFSRSWKDDMWVWTWADGAFDRTSHDDVAGLLLSTGADDSFGKQGIYDFAGNSWEWTLEYSSSSDMPCVCRGGHFGSEGSYSPASMRYDNFTDSHDEFFSGFRVSLY